MQNIQDGFNLCHLKTTFSGFVIISIGLLLHLTSAVLQSIFFLQSFDYKA
jgi:hypothetical protein